MRIKINGKEIEAVEGKTILETADENNIEIPRLCYHEDMTPEARCRLCVVEINGKLTTSCNTKVQEGMDILTDSKKVLDSRKMNVELMLARLPEKSLPEDNRLYLLSKKLGIEKPRFERATPKKDLDDNNPSIIRDSSKCVLCGKCVQKCQAVQEVCAIGYAKRGINTSITAPFNHKLNDIPCMYCGQCSLVCPVDAIKERDDTEKVIAAIKDPKKHVVVQTAPAIRAAIGEEVGMPPGSLVTKKMVTALKKLGFDKVFDTDFAADLTIMEEGSELIERIKNNGVLPLITSCSPGWIKFCEHFYPELLPNLSSCKSPQQMFGAIAKTYYAKKNNINPADIFVVSIMPCTAKKFECTRPEMNSSGYQDVDAVLTTRELGRWLRKECIKFEDLEDSDFDPILGVSTGAGAIFGNTGGVMEAALRTAYELITGKELKNIEFTTVRGLKGLKEAEIDIDGLKVKVAVAHGLGNARRILDRVKNGEKFHFIEIMTCPGGCIGGGGQPKPTNSEVLKKRIEALYKQDRELKYRKSHENPEVMTLYKEFLIKPLGEKSHKLLHTHYKQRK